MNVLTRDQFVLLSLLAYLTLEIFSGPLRMALSLIGLSAFIYLPKFMLGLATLWMLISEPLQTGFTHRRLISLVIIGYACAVGLLFCSAKQVAMGLWVLLPFWYGLTCANVVFEHLKTVNRTARTLWVAAVGGVLVNNFFVWPWEGYAYSVGAVEVEGAREWWSANGIKRLAGFSRSSFDAAVQVQLLGLIAAISTSRFLFRVLIWTFTFTAVYLTTSKGVLLVFVVCTPFVIFRGLVPESILRPLPAAIGTLGLILPISTLLFTFTPDRSGQAFLVNVLFSFYERLNDMWPKAWALLNEHGHFLMGRGIGGIGTAQSYFELSLSNAADNLFMYWFVVFGWSVLPAFAALLLLSLSLRPYKSELQMVVFSLLTATLVYGLTTNIVENAAFAITFGLVVRVLTQSSDRYIQQTHQNPLRAAQ